MFLNYLFFLNIIQLSNFLKSFEYNFFNKIRSQFHITPFCIAVKKGHLKIINILLSNDKLDVNLPCI